MEEYPKYYSLNLVDEQNTCHFLFQFAMSAITTEMTFQKLLRKAKTIS